MRTQVILLLSAIIMLTACQSNQTSKKMDNYSVNNIEDLAFPLVESNDAYAQYFSGQSYLADLGGGYHNVTFEPGCRNNGTFITEPFRF